MRKTTAPKDRFVATYWMPASPKGRDKRPVMHVFGPYTLSQARKARRALLEEILPEPGTLEVQVCKPIDVDAMNAPPNQEE